MDLAGELVRVAEERFGLFVAPGQAVDASEVATRFVRRLALERPAFAEGRLLNLSQFLNAAASGDAAELLTVANGLHHADVADVV